MVSFLSQSFVGATGPLSHYTTVQHRLTATTDAHSGEGATFADETEQKMAPKGSLIIREGRRISFTPRPLADSFVELATKMTHVNTSLHNS